MDGSLSCAFTLNDLTYLKKQNKTQTKMILSTCENFNLVQLSKENDLY